MDDDDDQRRICSAEAATFTIRRALESVEIGKYAANSERSGLGRTDPTQIIIIIHPESGPVSATRQ